MRYEVWLDIADNADLVEEFNTFEEAENYIEECYENENLAPDECYYIIDKKEDKKFF